MTNPITGRLQTPLFRTAQGPLKANQTHLQASINRIFHTQIYCAKTGAALGGLYGGYKAGTYVTLSTIDINDRFLGPTFRLYLVP